jgi:hypothetical protein
MAIQFKTTIGIDEYPNAYAKIVSQSSDNNGDKTNFAYQVSIFASKDHKEAGVIPVDYHRDEVMIVDMVSVDIAGLYAHLAQHPKFIDGVAV